MAQVCSGCKPSLRRYGGVPATLLGQWAGEAGPAAEVRPTGVALRGLRSAVLFSAESGHPRINGTPHLRLPWSAGEWIGRAVGRAIGRQGPLGRLVDPLS